MNLNAQQLGGGVGAVPVLIVRHGARTYQQAVGLHTVETHPNRTVIDSSVIPHVADAYHALPDADRTALPAFRALAEETKWQFDHLTRPINKGGMGFEVHVSRTDPYDVSMPGAMKKFFTDVAQRRMTVLATAITGTHPLFPDDVNDQFRAVHDVFGHAGTGRGVDRHGEEAAYRKHSTMYTPLARSALASETRGQNHAMIHAGGYFQAQKIGILPERIRAFSYVAPRSRDALHTSLLQARQFQREQGLVQQ